MLKYKTITFSKVKSQKSGFTLIELMVASTIFIIVMVIAIGSVLSIVNVNRKAQSLNSVMTNLDFALESMVRDIREGNNYCGTGTLGCPPTTNSQSISLTNTLGHTVTYSFQQITNAQGQQTGEIMKTVDGGIPYPVTAPEVNITNMLFSIKGNGTPDYQQPIVLLIIQGKTGANLKTQSTFQVETLITQRLLDS